MSAPTLDHDTDQHDTDPAPDQAVDQAAAADDTTTAPPTDIDDGEDTTQPTLDDLDARPAATAPTPGSALALRKPTMAEKVHWAEQLCRSDLLPREYRNKPANLLFAAEYAGTLGLTTMAAVQGIHVIEGKPSASGSLMTALARNAGHRVRLGYSRVDGQRWGIGWCEITRHDDPDYTFRVEWELGDAIRAGLCTLDSNGDPYSRSEKGKPQSWEKYPKAMLKWRAVTECVREACEEVLYGAHYTAEEMNIEMDEQGNAIIVDGEVVSTTLQPDIAAHLVGDDPINWERLTLDCHGDPGRISGVWARARDERPDNHQLHDTISATIPWGDLIGTAEGVRDLDALRVLHQRATGMRPKDRDLITAITEAGARVNALLNPPATDDNGHDGPAAEEAPAVDTTTAPEPAPDTPDAAPAPDQPDPGPDQPDPAVDEPPAKPTRQKAITSIQAAALAAQAATDLVHATTPDRLVAVVEGLHAAVARRDVSGVLGDHADTLGIRSGDRVTVADLARRVTDYVTRHGVSVAVGGEYGGNPMHDPETRRDGLLETGGRFYDRYVQDGDR